jgi:outer membrane protein OmpA-like peptidoglycan-associated protein
MALHRMTCLPAALALAATVLMAEAGAQPRDPSASEIIDALRPKPGQFQPATRGIRPVSPQQGGAVPAQPPAAQQTPAPAQAAVPPAAPAEAPAISLTVQFATGSVGLTDQAVRVLDELGTALMSEDLRPYRFRIEGHTDTVGSRELNQSLSERRAAAVRSYLAARHGVDASRLIAVGFGETRLAVPTADNIDEPGNRRVQIVNIGG